jgi:hypothetical protein
MDDSIDKYVKQTYRYYYDDGLVEIIVGFLFAGVGTALLLVLNLDLSSFLNALLLLVITALVIGGAFLIRRMVLRLKEQITYSRSGYVAFRQDESDRSRWFLLVAVAMLFVTLIFLPETFNQIQFMVGSMLAAVLIYLGYRLSLRRFYALGIACLLIGVASTIWIDDEFIGTAVALVGCGLLLLFSGGLTFAFYLRQYPESGREQS